MDRYGLTLARASAFVVGVIAGVSGAFAQQQTGADAEVGKALARQWCQQCHVVGPNEPNVTEGPEIGPNFMSIKAISVPSLDARLHSKHPTMPQFPTIVKRTDDIVAYINTINK